MSGIKWQTVGYHHGGKNVWGMYSAILMDQLSHLASFYSIMIFNSDCKFCINFQFHYKYVLYEKESYAYHGGEPM